MRAVSIRYKELRTITELYENDENSISNEIERNQENYIFKNENENGFMGEIMINQDHLKQISKTKLKLETNQVFKETIFKSLKNTFSRKNEILYCISTREQSVDISDTTGKVFLPLLTKEEITKKLNRLKPELKRKINTVHLGTVKILIKSYFREGINSPIQMALIDDRINSRTNCVLGAAKGNLAYSKFMFTVYPKFGISLQTVNLNKILSFIHEFERSDLMNKGDKVFSITYLVGYALTNSHHSIDYARNPNIELDEVFQDIGTVNSFKFAELEPNECNWAIDIAQNKPELNKQRIMRNIIRNRLEIGETSGSKPDENNMSKRMDRLEEHIQRLNINQEIIKNSIG
ncbi:hypothetical protein R6Q59_015649 [Mikania micrantha]